jgi:Flp pilus assembly protein TadB
MDPAEGRQESPLRVGSQPQARGDLEAGRRRARLAMLCTLVALAVSFLAPTPLGFAAAAIILLGVGVAMWTVRCPQCGRRLGPIIAFKYCTWCGSRIA